jgi:hypothetical protein
MTTLRLSHKKNEECGFKKDMSKLKLKNTASSNEKFMSEVH